MSLMTMIMKMSEGLGKTCAIFFLTLLFSLPLGMIVALLRMSKLKIVSAVTRFIITVLTMALLPFTTYLMWPFGILLMVLWIATTQQVVVVPFPNWERSETATSMLAQARSSPSGNFQNWL